jgi:hypothetical protein
MTSYLIAIVQEKLKNPDSMGRLALIFIKLDNLTCGSLSCVGLFAVDFEHPFTPRLAAAAGKA